MVNAPQKPVPIPSTIGVRFVKVVKSHAKQKQPSKFIKSVVDGNPPEFGTARLRLYRQTAPRIPPIPTVKNGFNVKTPY
ncbi:hypothetical protein AO843_23155 [Lysinibacillus sp. ZYM-1]|nr:hypothetical protein AO843_23155 [Lysinibacillus sp. ZYM-1]